MSKTSLWLILAVGLLTAAAAGCVLYAENQPAPAPTIELPEEAPPEFGVLFEVYSALMEDHYNRAGLDPTTLSRGAIRGMLDALDDDHAAYLDPELFNTEQERFRGSFEGIGAEVSARNGRIIVVAPIPNTPAEAAGIRSGDEILEVDGVSTEGMGIFDVVAKIRGPEGTPVTLLVLHQNDSSPVLITITRGVVKVSTVDVRILSGGIAHLQVHFFGENTSSDFNEALDRIRRLKARGLVLDIRDNPGGRVDAVVAMTSQFLNSGLVLYQVDGWDRRTDYAVRSGGRAKDIPMVTLINDFSASSSEIMAGALRDHNRSQLIGVKTFGKGSVNVQRSLSDGSGIYYSIARWFTPSGSLIEGEGIEPDIEVPSDPEGTADPQLDRAIEELQALIAAGS